MKFIKTKILDVHDDNIDRVKIKLANEIISKIGINLDSEFLHYTNLKQDLSESLQKINYDVTANKNILNKISKEFSRKLIQKELIDIIIELCKHVNLANNSELRSHIKLVLKTIDDLQKDRLIEQLNKFKALLKNNT